MNRENENNISNNRNNNKWFLMICELYNPFIHGQTTDSCVETHYLVYDRFNSSGISYQDLENGDFDLDYDTDDEYESDDDNSDDRGLMTINKSIKFLRENYSQHNFNTYPAHPSIRNYQNIISRPDYIKPEIGQYILLPTLESVAILKTLWLRIVQRTWKNIFKKRQNIIKNRCNPKSIYTRELTGKWPANFGHIPGLKGMLYKLKRIN